MISLYSKNIGGLSELRGNDIVSAVTVLSCCGFWLVGYGNGVLGGLITQDQFLSRFGYPSSADLSLITAIYGLGAFTGALLVVWQGDGWGRRQTVAIGAVVMALGCVLQVQARSVATLEVARFVAGIGLGAINSAVPVLQAESSPGESRGRHVAMYCTTLNVGILGAYWIDYALSKVQSNLSWQIPILAQLAVLAFICVTTLLIPEPARWLMAHDMQPQALEVLGQVLDDEANSWPVIEEFDRLNEAIENEEDEASQKSLLALFYRHDNLQSARRLWTSLGIQVFQQLGGVNLLVFFTTTLFQDSIGLSPATASLMSVLLQGWLVVASCVPWQLIDRVGRIPLILGGISGQMLAMALLGIFVQIIEGSKPSTWASTGAIMSLFLFQGAFTIGMQSTVWVYCSEILPLNVRNRGTAISTSANWMSSFLILQFGPQIIETLGYASFWILAAINLAFLPIVFFFFKETAGQSLEDIDHLFIESDEHGADESPEEPPEEPETQALRPATTREASTYRTFDSPEN